MNEFKHLPLTYCVCALAAFVIGGCTSKDEGVVSSKPASSCMSCHNGSQHDDYGGLGLENPHPFPGGGTLSCETCHGGNPGGVGLLGSHIPPPPEIGDRANLEQDRLAYFNRLTLTGIDKFPDYTVAGINYTALDYLQFINPGDLRVVNTGRSCGNCHQSHVECVSKGLLATAAGMLSGAKYAIGVDAEVAGSQGLYQDTASDLAFRAVSDPGFAFDPLVVGPVQEVIESPVYSVRGREGPDDIFRNPLYASSNLPNSLRADNSVIAGSPLANLYHEQVSFTCGDCHLGSAGANNRYGDYRSSGCTACHMRYSLDGRSRSTDPNIRKLEPLDPNDIDEPERPHVKRHMITSIARTLVTGEVVQGMDDYTCAGCHQGSNRTVMQYWGIRLDQNQDLRRDVQYPANPASYVNTRNDTRLFDPEVGNNEFNGRNANQYILFEDYDDDARDDTPPDVHYEAGLGCIDCHGSHDLHGGNVSDPGGQRLLSRQEQAVAIRCESCHGSVDAYASTISGFTYSGTQANLAVDARGNALKHVVRESAGTFYLTSRLTGKRHYVPQTRDVVVDSGKNNPLSGETLYSVKASYAMGRADGDPSTGLGPQQVGAVSPGFSHGDNVSCIACHSSWTNNCIGCHLKGEYNGGNNFSNITGERIVYREENADFVYQSPVFFQLGIDTHNMVSPITANTTTFYQYKDIDDQWSDVFAFSDRNGGGNDGNGITKNVHPALSHNVMMPHSIRGKVSATNEGPRYCVACHLTDESLDVYQADYEIYRVAIQNNNFAALDFDVLKEHIGQNTGNQMNSPYWVHMVAGLGTGLFLFDENGCPVNPLDTDENRFFCEDNAPADNYDPANVRYNLDRIVETSGVSNGSNNHPMDPKAGTPDKRDGASNQNLSGPLGADLIDRLTNPDPNFGIILDSWIDADGDWQGDSNAVIQP